MYLLLGKGGIKKQIIALVPDGNDLMTEKVVMLQITISKADAALAKFLSYYIRKYK